MRIVHAVLAASILGLSPALAADPESCKTVRLSDPGWTDITSTDAIASVLLAGLGYAPEVKTLSVPIGYRAMKDGDSPRAVAYCTARRRAVSISCVFSVWCVSHSSPSLMPSIASQKPGVAERAGQSGPRWRLYTWRI